MSRTPVSIATALMERSEFRGAVRPNTGALRRQDISLIAEQERPKVGDSLDLDEATRRAYPNDNRWDYLLSVPASARIVGMEPHTAKDAEIAVVIKKKATAVAVLRSHLRPRAAIDDWLWVASGPVGFSRMERARRRLDQSGITFVGRLLRSL